MSLPTPAHEPNQQRASEGRAFMIGLTVTEVVAAILIVNLVTRNGGSDFSAYMWAMTPPLIGATIYWFKTKQLSRISIIILGFNLFSALLTLLGSHDSKVLLYKDCAVTGLFGVAFLVSLFFARPLTFWFGERFAAGSTQEGRDWWDSLWQHESFRRLQRRLSMVWAAIMLIEAGVKAAVITANSFATAFTWSQVIPLVATALGVIYTVVETKRLMAAGRGAERGAPATS